MGCYDPPVLPMSKLMKWWAYHQEEPFAFPGNRYPKRQNPKPSTQPQSMNDSMATLRGLTHE